MQFHKIPMKVNLTDKVPGVDYENLFLRDETLRVHTLWNSALFHNCSLVRQMILRLVIQCKCVYNEYPNIFLLSSMEELKSLIQSKIDFTMTNFLNKSANLN